MVQQANPNGAPEVANVQGDEVDLEALDAYIRRAKADVHRSKARAANWVALILVLGLVLSLPFYAVAIASVSSEPTATHVERIFLKWYDVVSPLVGAVVGAARRRPIHGLPDPMRPAAACVGNVGGRCQGCARCAQSLGPARWRVRKPRTRRTAWY